MNLRIIVLIALAAMVLSIPTGAEINETHDGGGNGTCPQEWNRMPMPVVTATTILIPTTEATIVLPSIVVPTPESITMVPVPEPTVVGGPIPVAEIRGEVVDAATQIAPFTWTGQNFAGLYYDVDRNLMSDSLISTVTIPDTIENGDLAYTTYRVESCYKNPEIGEYFAIGWFGERYMAVNGKPYLVSPIILEMGDGGKKTLAIGDEWYLGNGYSLVVTRIDLAVDEAWLSLFKNGVEVASSVIQPRETGDWFCNCMCINGFPGAYDVVMWNAPTTSTFVYQADVGDEADVPIFSVYVDAIFRGTETNIAQFKHAMLIDDNPVKVVETGAGMMKMETVTPESVRLVNSKNIDLHMGDIGIAGDLRIHVADDLDGNGVSNYRYYPYVNRACTAPDLGPAPTPTPTPTPKPHPVDAPVEVRGEVVEVDKIGRLSAVGEHNYQTGYIWNLYNFAAFRYDLDEDRGSESMIINTTPRGWDNRIIEDSQLIYRTIPQPQDYRYYKDVGEALGTVDGNNVTSYAIEGWIAEEYVAIGTGGSAATNANKLAKLLVEFDSSSDMRTLATEDAWDLGGGFTLTARQIDPRGNKVWLSLAKNGKEIDSSVIDADTDSRYLYTEDISGVEDVVVFFCNVDATFRGIESNLVQVKYVFLIDNDVENVEPGTSYGNMEVRTASADRIELTNDGDLDLSEGDDVAIVNNIYFRVAENDTVRFYPYKLYTGAGDYDVRGTVIEANATGRLKETVPGSDHYSTGYTWNPYNFATFWYDLDDDMGSEKLMINTTLTDSGRTIPDEQLIYTTSPQRQRYEIARSEETSCLGVVGDNNVTYYYLEGWMAEKYVAISTGGSTVPNADKLAKLLIEFESCDDKKTLATGEVWDLGGGFTLTARQIDLNGDKVWLSLAKNGKEIDATLIDSSKSGDRRYLYTEDIAGVEDVVVFFCWVDAVFRGTESNIVQVQHVFLIDNDVDKIELGRTYGNMEVMAVSGSQIVLKNDGDLDLSRNTVVEIMKGMYFRVADNDTARFYPFAERTIRGAVPPASEEPEEVSILDTDCDGVPNFRDKEPDTPQGYWVNPQGIGRMLGHERRW
ncbi:MAG: S-layer protein domain-containing protein [Euryarchaeota archaeon]|nr:S-layer protein domain-containing protein [Euryarchaeota archaeon]